MKAISLDCTDFKRIKALHIDFKPNGLTIVGGKNRAGKTSVLDALAYLIGGESYRPVNCKRNGSEDDPFLRVTLGDGIIVERSGKDSSLKVIDETGTKQGQRLLNAFFSKIAIDLPKFLNASDSDKAKVLLDLLGIDKELKQLDDEETTKYQERTYIGREHKQKDNAAKELPFYEGLPEQEVSLDDLYAQLDAIQVRNASIAASVKKIEANKERLGRLIETGENLAAQRDALDGKAAQQKETVKANAASQQEAIDRQIKSLLAQKEQIAVDAERQLKQIDASVVTQKNTCEVQIAENTATIDALTEEIVKAENINTSLEDTSEIKNQIAQCQDTNAKIRANQKRKEMVDEAVALQAAYEKLDAEIDEIRQKRIALLNGADLPYPGLSVKDFGDGPVLTLNEIPWSDCSGAEQLIVSAAIAFAVKSASGNKCNCVLMDKMEQFDEESLAKFDKWLVSQDKQVIATRVSTSDECSFIIEDGYVKGMEDVVIDKTVTRAKRRDKSASDDMSEDAEPVSKGNPYIKKSEVIGEGKRIEIPTTSSATMSKAQELLARRRASIMAKVSSDSDTNA